MILPFLLLDLFFYNYTSFASCFFLLSFLRGKTSILSIMFWGFLWDFFFLHTKGLFVILLLVLWVFRKNIKGINKPFHLLLSYFLVTIIFLSFSYIFFAEYKIYKYGLFLNLLVLSILNIYEQLNNHKKVLRT